MRITNKFKFIRSMAILIFLLIALFNISVAKSDEEAENNIIHSKQRRNSLEHSRGIQGRKWRSKTIYLWY